MLEHIREDEWDVCAYFIKFFCRLVCIYNLFPPMWKSFLHLDTSNTFFCWTEYFKNSFFSSVINDWIKLDSDVCDSRNYDTFLKSLPKCNRPVEWKINHINDLAGIRLPTRLRLSFSCLHKHKYFMPLLNALYSYNIEAGNTTRF